MFKTIWDYIASFFELLRKAIAAGIILVLLGALLFFLGDSRYFAKDDKTGNPTEANNANAAESGSRNREQSDDGPIEALHKTLVVLGTGAIGAGFFAAMTKYLQFKGIFREEITKVLSDPTYIKERKQYVRYWLDVSKGLIEDRFPNISDKLLEEVKNLYIPVESDTYVEDLFHHYDIRRKNENTDKKVIITYTSNFKIVCRNTAKTVFHIKLPKVANTKDIKCTLDDKPIDLDKNKVSTEEEGWLKKFLPNKFKKIRTSDSDSDFDTYNIILDKNKTSYQFSKKEDIEMNLEEDDIIHFTSPYLIHRVNIVVSFQELYKIKFSTAGVINIFRETNKALNNSTYINEGFTYPGQGYFFEILTT